MAHFTFDFSIDEGKEDSRLLDGELENGNETSLLSSNKEEEKEILFEFLVDVPGLLRVIENKHIRSTVVKNLTIGNGKEFLSRICIAGESGGHTHEHVEKNLDIIPGKYEGGLKLWECSLDLCRYILKELDKLRPMYTIELGCGHGLPGCLVLQRILSNKIKGKVFFTDFNDFVLRDVTLANICLNTKNYMTKDVLESIILGAGDWDKMSAEIVVKPTKVGMPQTGRFNLFLAAETTYTVEAANATARLLAVHLDPIHGIGLIATKRYYFGCGGGVDVFRSAAASQRVKINGEQYRLKVRNLEVYDSGGGNIRELLQVSLDKDP